MIIGLDVGGTHTDVALMDRKEILFSTKVLTDHQHLLHSIRDGIAATLRGRHPTDIQRVHLSTTLCTNAIVEDRVEAVGMFVSAGPGIDPEAYRIGEHYHLLDGFIDHRGTEIRPLQLSQIGQAVACCREAGVSLYAAVTKFSPRNPAHEELIAEQLKRHADYTTSGHQLSGALNFPRRIATAYYNSAVWRMYNTFADAVAECLTSFGIQADVHIIKADGGTMPLSVCRRFPVESILSGPAASVMGISALCDIHDDAVVLDIGGTTTDIAIFADGVPLLEPQGIALNSHQTLVRALKTRSIGIGGDSAIHADQHAVTVGPLRAGPSMANGGSVPSLLDACNVAGLAEHGNLQASQDGLRRLAGECNMVPDALAERAIQYAILRIQEEVDALLTEINAKPVYTIHELLEGKTIAPQTLYVMGGPAQALARPLNEIFRRPVVIPEHFAVANAVGAALTRHTQEIELFADTEKQVLLIPTLNVRQNIPARYSLDDAKRDAVRFLQERVRQIGAAQDTPRIEITEAEAFNMVNGFSTTGRNIRVKCQIRPGIL